MSPQRARIVANILLIAGATTAAYFIFSRPRVRRAIWNLSRSYLATLPEQLKQQVSTAWIESGRTS